jgi:hypothetical protein
MTGVGTGAASASSIDGALAMPSLAGARTSRPRAGLLLAMASRCGALTRVMAPGLDDGLGVAKGRPAPGLGAGDDAPAGVPRGSDV